MPNDISDIPDIPTDLDVLVVGAGFGGIHQLYNYRKLGYSVKIFEAASDLGGIWYWNCYPGARVDSDVPLYELSLPELTGDWSWSERFPGWQEIRKYFQYIEQKLQVRKDTYFNKRVVSASFDAEVDRWIVTTEDGTVVHPRFLVLCLGFAAKTYTPSIKGLETFKGAAHHTAKWPQEGLDVKGKRVAVVGTGASGVQVIQEVGPEVSHLTVFQRTPNFCLPMQQRILTETENEKNKKVMNGIVHRRRRQTVAGFSFDRNPVNLFDATPEERVLYWEDLWAKGGLRFAVSNYNNMLTDQDANNEIYAFWRDKVRERLNDPEMQEKLAPTVPPHPFGAKRMSLEQRYYEVFNQPNVTLVDLEKCPISEITPKGIVTSDGIEHELDVIAFATGFDSVTGGLTQIDIRGVDGRSIGEKWAQGVYTTLGMTTVDFPNMFFIYGPQAPTAFCNAPTCNEIQGEWIVGCIKHMMDNHITRIDATREAEEDWRQQVLYTHNLRALASKAKTSWYMGSNIPGKVVEPLNYSGGVNTYDRIIIEKAAKGYEGFVFSSITKSES